MSIGEQLQNMYEGIDRIYKPRFVSKTQQLLDDRVNETHNFLDASLEFQNGDAIWRQDLPISQDLPILELLAEIDSIKPFNNPEIHIQSAVHAYELFKKYYTTVWFSKEGSYVRGIEDLERFCSD